METVRIGGLWVLRVIFSVLVVPLTKTTEAVLFLAGVVFYLWNASFGVFPPGEKARTKDGAPTNPSRR